MSLVALSMAASARGEDVKLWMPVVVSVAPENEPIRLHLELQPRFDDDLTGAEALVVRPGLGLELRPNLTLLAGYAWVPSFREPTEHEHRTWQQIRYARQRQPREYELRARLEQRYLPGGDGTSWRLRSRAQTAVQFAPGWRWAVGNEVFITLNETVASEPRGVGQNRFDVGIDRAIGSILSLQPRYMVQYERLTSSGRAHAINHVFMIGIDVSLR